VKGTMVVFVGYLLILGLGLAYFAAIGLMGR
jgi:hypothetical protein